MAIEHFHLDLLPGLLNNWPYPLVKLNINDKFNFTNV